MTESAVAYSFSLPDDEAVHYLKELSDASKPQSEHRIVITFTSSEECRLSLQKSPVSESVIVCNTAGVVTPINLAAALCADTPERDVYLMEDYPTEALASRARAAGIRGILDSSQTKWLLGVEQAIPTASTARSSTKGRIIGFFSGRGGVGKSTVALMAALSAQGRGARVALVDLDLQFGDLNYLAGREPSSRIQRLSLEQCCAGPGLCSLPDEALTLIIPPSHPEQGEVYAQGIPSLLLGLAAQKDLVVVNTGSFWSEIHAQTVQCCDHLAFLMDQRATSIEACKQVADLCVRMQAPQARFIYLLNGCGRHASLTTQDVMLALGGVEVFGIADGGSLVDELLALGCPMELLSSGNAFVASLEALLDVLLGKQKAGVADGIFAPPAGGKARIFDLFSLRGFFGGANRVAT